MPRKPRNSPNPAGRPSLVHNESLFNETTKAVQAAIRAGNYIDVAFLMNNVDPKTAREWFQRGRLEPDGPHGEFLRSVRQALAYSEVRDLSVIDSFAHGRPAEYQMEPMIVDGEIQMEPVLNPQGQPYPDPDRPGKFLMKPMQRITLDGDGKPIVRRSELKPNWYAAAWKLERRAPKRWGRFDRIQIDDMSTIDQPPERDANKPPEKDKGPRTERLAKLRRDLTVLGEIDSEEDLD